MIQISSFASVDPVLDDRLYVGNYKAAISQDVVGTLGITHIVSVCPDYPETGANHLHIPVQDSEYEDILIHLPTACRFIQDAFASSSKTKVLVHCIMGVSRSATVAAAYLMKARRMSSSSAIKLIRQRRPVIHPNYGFRRQLHVFAACNYEPAPDHPAYRSWKRSHKRTMKQYLGLVQDCIAVVPDQIYVCSDFPCQDAERVESILLDLSITHLLALSPVNDVSCPLVKHNVSHVGKQQSGTMDSILASLSDSCSFLRTAVQTGGQALVYSDNESYACMVVCAFLMVSRDISPSKACSIVQEALPLFHCSQSFMPLLDAFSRSTYRTQLSLSSSARLPLSPIKTSSSSSSSSYPRTVIENTRRNTISNHQNTNTSSRTTTTTSTTSGLSPAATQVLADKLCMLQLADSVNAAAAASSTYSTGGPTTKKTQPNRTRAASVAFNSSVTVV